MNKLHPAARTWDSLALKVLLLCALSVCLSGGATAQDSSNNPLDGFTPAGLQPGSPAGSFRLGGMDTVNPYNGHLNFSLPLLQVGGRTSAGYTIQQLIASKWTVTYSVTHDDHGGSFEYFEPTNGGWGYLGAGYSPGILVGRQSNANTRICYNQTNDPLPFPVTSLTRLTFTWPDGTETELRDQQLGGQPAAVPDCPSGGANRGKIFTSSDGRSATFISDDDIIDTFVVQQSPVEFGASGYLRLRDGTVYRMDGGQVAWIRDRNGNKLTFGYGTYGVSSITDSVGRQITIEYGVTDQTYGRCNRITYRGFGGVSRTIWVTLGSLGSALRPGSNYSVQAVNALFP